MRIIRGQMFLTTGEAAQMLGVSARTMLRWSSDEGVLGIVAVKDPGGRTLFRKEDVERLVDQHFDRKLVRKTPPAQGHRAA